MPLQWLPPLPARHASTPELTLLPLLPLAACPCAQEKVTLLERLDFEQVQESECKKVFTRYRLAETY